MSGREIELAIAEVEVVDPHLKQHLKLINHALRGTLAYHHPLCQGISTVNASFGAATLRLYVAHTPFRKVSAIIHRVSFRGGHVVQIDVFWGIATVAFSYAIHETGDTMIILSTRYLGQ
jgi:hypothetical protein